MRQSRIPFAAVTAALALCASFGLSAGPLTAQEGATCGGDEPCSDTFADPEGAVQDAWDAGGGGGIYYETSSEGGEGGGSGGTGGSGVLGWLRPSVAHADCITMTIFSSSTLTALLTQCITGGADPETTFLYTVTKLNRTAAGTGWYAAESGAEPSGSSTDPTTTTTWFSVVPSPSVVGQSVALTARVTPVAPGTPVGSIEFYEGATLLGTGTVSRATPSSPDLATINHTFGAGTVGSHTLTAIYTGDPFYSGSTSPNFVQAVVKADTTTALMSGTNPSDCSETVLLTATVTVTDAGAVSPATGSVEFRDGATLLATQPLSGGVATLSTAFSTAGAHGLTATYLGSANHFDSSSALVTQNVGACCEFGADGTNVTTDGTTSASCTDLAGTVQLDDIVPFTSGSITGTVQNRVVLSDNTNTLHFYMSIRDLAGGNINYVVRTGFAGFINTGGCSSTPIDYRPDGLGVLPVDDDPFESNVQSVGSVRLFSTGSGDDILPDTGGEASKFVYIMTNATSYSNDGCMTIYFSDGSNTTITVARPN